MFSGDILQDIQNRKKFQEYVLALASTSKSYSSKEEKNADLEKILGLLDITSLNDTDYFQSINKIVENSISRVGERQIPCAGVCVYSNLLPFLQKSNLDSRIKKVCVSGGFPHGQMSLQGKLHDVGFAIENGACEVDIPINRGLFFENPFELKLEIQAIKSIVRQNPNAKLKVILETGELGSFENIHKACELAIDSGADFIKTSTGKVSRGADLYSAAIMLFTIKTHFINTSKLVGFKAAGGIRTSLQALEYFHLAKNIMGEQFLSAETFRIGCSNLKDDILNEINKVNYE